MAILGIIIKFSGCYLSVKYRERSSQSCEGWVGGPMYYLSKGLGFKKIAKCFSLFTIISALTVGNLVQVNSIALPLADAGISPIYTGCFMAILVALVLIKGVRTLTKIATRIVPFMSIIYLLSCLIILTFYHHSILPALKLIIQAAFNPTSVAGGTLGYSIFQAIRVGFDRGLFATDAGVGIAPILHAQVNMGKTNIDLQELAFIQGMVSTVAPLIVMLICMITGLVLLTTNTWQMTSLQSTNICTKAFVLGLNHLYAGYIVIFTLTLFAFTTILTWAHCAEKAVSFLLPKHAIYWFRWCFIIMIPIGACCSVQLVWLIADIALNNMLLINIIGIIGLSKEVIGDYQARFLGKSTQSIIANTASDDLSLKKFQINTYFKFFFFICSTLILVIFILLTLS